MKVCLRMPKMDERDAAMLLRKENMLYTRERAYAAFLFRRAVGSVGWLLMSDTTIPRIQQFMPKKAILASHSPGTKVEWPRNSSSYP